MQQKKPKNEKLAAAMKMAAVGVCVGAAVAASPFVAPAWAAIPGPIKIGGALAGATGAVLLTQRAIQKRKEAAEAARIVARKAADEKALADRRAKSNLGWVIVNTTGSPTNSQVRPTKGTPTEQRLLREHAVYLAAYPKDAPEPFKVTANEPITAAGAVKEGAKFDEARDLLGPDEARNWRAGFAFADRVKNKIFGGKPAAMGHVVVGMDGDGGTCGHRLLHHNMDDLFDARQTVFWFFHDVPQPQGKPKHAKRVAAMSNAASNGGKPHA